MNSDQQYWAFISYSSKDKKWGQWLHKRLENYPIPEEFQGQELFDGAVLGKNLRPVFRDRDELSGSSELGPAIERALQSTRFLIVLCSKNSAQSEWVNKEIADFKAMGKEGNILALILDGEPNATSQGRPEEECFPPELRYPAEPLAGDLRKEGDGKERGFLKVLAGIAQLDFDKLYRRHERAQAKKRLIAGVTAASLIVLFAGLTLFAFNQREEAVEQKGLAEKNLEIANDRLLRQLLQSADQDAELGRWDECVKTLEQAYMVDPENYVIHFMLDQALRNLECIDHCTLDIRDPIATAYDSTRGILAVGNSFGEILLWDIESRRVIHRFDDPIGDVTQLEFYDEDGRNWLISSGRDWVVRVYDLEEGILLNELEGHKDEIRGFAYEGDKLVTYGFDGRTLVWDLNSAELISVNKSTGFEEYAQSAWFVGGETVYTVDSSGKCSRLYLGAEEEREWEIVYDREKATDFAVPSPESSWVAFVSHGVEVEYVNLEDMTKRLNFSFSDSVQNLFFSLDGRRLWAVSNSGSVESRDLNTGLKSRNFENYVPPHHTFGDSLLVSRVSADRSHLALQFKRKGTILLHTYTGQIISHIVREAGTTATTALAFDQTKPNFVSIDDRGGLTLRESPVIVKPAHSDRITSFAVSENQKQMITGGRDGRIKLWESPGGQKIGELKHADGESWVLDLEFSSDGKQFVSAGGSIVQVREIETKSILNESQMDSGNSVIDALYLTDGSLLLLSVDDRLHRWDISVEGSQPEEIFVLRSKKFNPAPKYHRMELLSDPNLVGLSGSSNDFGNDFAVFDLEEMEYGDKDKFRKSDPYRDFAHVIMNNEISIIVHQKGYVDFGTRAHEGGDSLFARVNLYLPMLLAHGHILDESRGRLIMFGQDGSLLIWEFLPSEFTHDFVGRISSLKKGNHVEL